MKIQPQKVRRLLMSAFTLISVVALSLPNQPTNAVTGFCETCENNCYEDAWNWQTGTYAECRNNGGSVEACTSTAKLDYNGCVMLCNYSGCNIPPAQ